MVSGPYPKMPNGTIHVVPPTFADMEIFEHADPVWPNPEPKSSVRIDSSSH